MSEPLALYLKLAPEFGGTRFGPFEGAEVRLGSDQANNDIVLPETLGVATAHVKVFRQADMGIIVAPVERTAAVFVWQGRAARPKQINTPVAVRPGDSFALVTAQGPRFIVEMDELPEEVKKKREAARRMPGRRRLTAGAFKDEGKRQAWVAVLTTGPGQIAQRAYTFVVSGAIFMPRNIIMILGVAGGYVMGGMAMCSNFSLRDQVEAATGKAEEKEKQVQLLEDLVNNKDSTDLRFEELARQITGATQLAAALKDDPKLTGMVKEKARLIFQNSNKYEWLVNPGAGKRRANNFAEFRESLEQSDLDGDTARLLTYAAAVPDLSQESWTRLTDSDGNDVCARGPLGLTYRQARNLGLTASLDAYIQGNSADFDGEGSREARKAKLSETAAAANLSGDAIEEALDGESALIGIQTSREFCLYMEGEDQRESVSRITRAIERHMGDDGLKLPSTDVNYGITARLAKLYVADLATVDFNDRREPGFDLTPAAPGAVLEGNRGTWVLERSADTIARAMALPCVAVLNYGSEGGLDTTFGDLPNPISCLVLDWKLRNDK
ncbi:MAG: hypothetical protein H6739_09660 [Alphaproteobacteria bacterium]|nr:hypothetical protein [Alphaproteobacteria bacterium]